LPRRLLMLPLTGALAGQLFPCGLTPEPEVAVEPIGDVLLGVGAVGEAEVLLAIDVVRASALLPQSDRVKRVRTVRHAAFRPR